MANLQNLEITKIDVSSFVKPRVIYAFLIQRVTWGKRLTCSSRNYLFLSLLLLPTKGTQ
jgi:hypothetical protein